MRCEDIKEEMVSFVLGEPDESASKAIQAHLDSCEKCRADAAEYRRTLLALGRWSVPAHGRPPNFAFLPTPPAAREDMVQRRHSYRIFVPALIAASFVALFVTASLLGTQISYGGGKLSVSLGRPQAETAAADSARIAAIVDSVRMQDMQLVSKLIAASEARQAQLYRADLASFSRQINSRQRSYVTYMMDHIYRLQQQDQIAYYQSSAALNGVAKLASSVR
jgi:hypothetical protein